MHRVTLPVTPVVVTTSCVTLPVTHVVVTISRVTLPVTHVVVTISRVTLLVTLLLTRCLLRQPSAQAVTLFREIWPSP